MPRNKDPRFKLHQEENGLTDDVIKGMDMKCFRNKARELNIPEDIKTKYVNRRFYLKNTKRVKEFSRLVAPYRKDSAEVPKYIRDVYNQDKIIDEQVKHFLRITEELAKDYLLSNDMSPENEAYFNNIKHTLNDERNNSAVY